MYYSDSANVITEHRSDCCFYPKHFQSSSSLSSWHFWVSMWRYFWPIKKSFEWVVITFHIQMQMGNITISFWYEVFCTCGDCDDVLMFIDRFDKLTYFSLVLRDYNLSLGKISYSWIYRVFWHFGQHLF